MTKLTFTPPYESPSCSVIDIGIPASRICSASVQNYVVPGSDTNYDDDSD